MRGVPLETSGTLFEVGIDVAIPQGTKLDVWRLCRQRSFSEKVTDEADSTSTRRN